MSRSLPRVAIPAIAVLLVAALIGAYLLRGRGSPGESGTTGSSTGTVTDVEAEPGTKTAEPGVLDAEHGDASTTSDRQPLAATTVIRGVFTAPRGMWPGGGTAQLATYADPPPGGMFGMFDLGMEAARGQGRDIESRILGFLDRLPAVASSPVRADGSFRINDPPPGRFSIRLDHPALRVPASVVIEVAAGDERDVGTIGTVPAASLLALVTDTEGQPIEAAHLELARSIDPQQLTDPSRMGDLSSLLGRIVPRDARTDARGVARFTGLEGADDWVLTVEARARVEHRQTLRLEPGQENILRVEMLAGAILAAKVLGPDGEPHAGARLELRYPDLKRPTHMSAGPMGVHQSDETVSYRLHCDGDGMIERRGLPAGRAELHARTPGFCRTSQPILLALDETTAARVILDPGVTVRGRVVNEHGEPIADAHVLHVPMIAQEIMGFDLGEMIGAEFLSMGAAERGVPCEADGAFVLGGFEDGEEAQLIATAPGFDPAVARDVPAGSTGVELRLAPQCTLSGHVVDDRDGSAAEGFTVTLRKRAFVVMDRKLIGESFSGAAGGAFSLAPCPRDQVEMVVEAEGFARHSQGVDLTSGSTDVGEIRLLVPAAIEGTVVDPDGVPVEGASVRVSKGGMFDSRMMAQFSGERMIATDADGRFRLDELSGRAVRLIAEKEGLAPVKGNAMRIAPGETVTGVVLQLGRGGEIRGRLVDAEERPLPGWRVQAAHASGSSIAMAESGPNGEFRFDGLAGGTYKVDAMNLAAMEDSTVATHDLDEAIDFGAVMARVLENTVSDRVVVREGEIAELTLFYEGPTSAELGLSDVTGTVRVGTDPLGDGAILWMPPGTAVPRHVADVRDGRFEVRGMRPGTWRVQIQSGLFNSAVGGAQVVEIPAGPTHTIALDLPGGRIAGRVIDPRDGKAAAGCVVALIRPDATLAGGVERFDFGEGTALTDGDGRFAFAGVEPGDYEINAKQMFGTAGLTGRLSAVTIGAGQVKDDLEIVLEEGGALHVAVRDADGGVRANALVTVLGSQGAPLDMFHRTLTDVAGEVRFEGLPDGTYRVAVDAPGAAPTVSAPVEVRAGGAREVTVTLERGNPVTIVAIGGVPESLRGQLVLYAIWRGDGSLLRTGRLLLPDSENADAAVTIGRLAPGEYRARLEAPRLGIVDVTRRVPEQGDAVWRIELPR